MKRLNIKFYKGMNIKIHQKRNIIKKYETPKNIGEKVANRCKVCTK